MPKDLVDYEELYSQARELYLTGNYTYQEIVDQLQGQISLGSIKRHATKEKWKDKRNKLLKKNVKPRPKSLITKSLIATKKVSQKVEPQVVTNAEVPREIKEWGFKKKSILKDFIFFTEEVDRLEQIAKDNLAEEPDGNAKKEFALFMLRIQAVKAKKDLIYAEAKLNETKPLELTQANNQVNEDLKRLRDNIKKDKKG